MVSWSRKRRMIYALIIGSIILGAIVVPTFLFFYKAPTCFDSILNGKEQGVDCGGACSRLCASAFLSPSVAWTRFEEITPGFYNVAAYIINPNATGEAHNVPYRMMLYDSRGILIVEQKGEATLPPQRSTLVFARAVDTGKRIPTRVFFEFIGFPDWRSQSDPLASLIISDKKYSEDTNSSSLTVVLQNPGVVSYGPISVYAILYDISQNAIGFSKTVIDGIAPKGSVIAPFTWPLSRKGKVISIEVLPVAE